MGWRCGDVGKIRSDLRETPRACLCSQSCEKGLWAPSGPESEGEGDLVLTWGGKINRLQSVFELYVPLDRGFSSTAHFPCPRSARRHSAWLLPRGVCSHLNLPLKCPPVPSHRNTACLRVLSPYQCVSWLLFGLPSPGFTLT